MAGAANSMEIRFEGGKAEFLDSGRPVLTYNYRMVLPEGVPADRQRSCYIHPIYGLDGEVLTDDFPKDHFHHRGLSWMWLVVKVGDKTYDLWTIKGIRDHTVKLLDAQSSPESATLRMANAWITDGGEKVLDETVTITAHKAESGGRVIDLEISLYPTTQPVTLDSSATGYSGLNLRFAPREDTVIVTSSGKADKDVNRERYYWSDLSGKFAGSKEFSGIAIFDNPSNPSYPTGWSNRFYGILGPSFTAIQPVTIKPGKPLVLRYRVWVHKGDSSGVPAAYKAYSGGD
jgi:hypothetical protein